METLDYILLAIALCGVGRVWYERWQDNRELAEREAVERARQRFGRANVRGA